MNPTSLTSRPALSTVVISANVQTNSQTLDGLVTLNKEEKTTWLPSVKKVTSSWFSRTNYIGMDDNKHLMYSLTRSEYLLFTTIGVTGLTLMGSLLTWLFN